MSGQCIGSPVKLLTTPWFLMPIARAGLWARPVTGSFWYNSITTRREKVSEMVRRSFWAWGMESDEPTIGEQRDTAERLSRQYGVPLQVVPVPTVADLNLRQPRITPPSALATFCSSDTHDRAAHSYGRSYRDRIRAFNCHFPNPPDVVAHPRTEPEVERILEWCSTSGYAAIPYGGGSSVVGGVDEAKGLHYSIACARHTKTPASREAKLPERPDPESRNGC